MKLATLVGFGACSAAALAQPAMIDFEDFAPMTTFGDGSYSPGDTVFTRNGISASVENFTLGAFTGFSRVVIDGGFIEPALPNAAATISNINLKFDFSALGYTVDQVTFDYADLGGEENLAVNGSAIVELGLLSDAPAMIGGASVSVEESMTDGGFVGTVTITGDISDITIGGQEFGIDNLVALPAPGSIALLGLGALVATRRKRA